MNDVSSDRQENVQNALFRFIWFWVESIIIWYRFYVFLRRHISKVIFQLENYERIAIANKHEIAYFMPLTWLLLSTCWGIYFVFPMIYSYCLVSSGQGFSVVRSREQHTRRDDFIKSKQQKFSEIKVCFFWFKFNVVTKPSLNHICNSLCIDMSTKCVCYCFNEILLIFLSQRMKCP